MRRRALRSPLTVAWPGVLLLVQAMSCLRTHGAGSAATAAPPRPATWAQPLKKPGLPNLHKLDATLYRGAQPTAQGMRELHKMGVKTVVNLRAFHSDRDEIGSTPLAYEHIAMTPLAVTDARVVRFLKIVTDRTRTPAFVHCQHGADRTGVLCAAYRIAVQGWSKHDAIREMIDGGYGHHRIFGNLAEYLREADFAKIRREAGLPKPPGKGGRTARQSR